MLVKFLFFSAVEHAYKLAKKALNSREHVDKQATDMANKLQAELTEQRKHSDDLRTKIRWLEDCMDKSKKGWISYCWASSLTAGNTTDILQKFQAWGCRVAW